jgi:predicted ATPase
MAAAMAEDAEPNRPMRVLFTGGPGAGKSSAIATLRDRLSKRGFRVVVVPEAATSLLVNSPGFDNDWRQTRPSKKLIELQKIILKYQLDHEDAHEAMARLGNGRAVILFDRGTIDGRLFTTEEEWAQVLEDMGQNDEKLLARYDLAIHVTSCAHGLPNVYDYGPGSSNPARHHTPEEAKEADALTQQLIAKSHPQVRVVPNFESFSDKISCVLGIIEDALHVDGLAGQRERIELRDDTILLALSQERPMEDVFVPGVRIFQHNITTFFTGDGQTIECLRKRTRITVSDREGEGEETLYELRVQHGPSLMTRRILTAHAYELLLAAQPDASCVKKDAACFDWDGKYYEVIRYTVPKKGDVIVLDYEVGARIPAWMEKARKISDLDRPLRRNHTVDMIEPSPYIGAGGKTLFDQLARPDIKDAAALVPARQLNLESPVSCSSPSSKRRRFTESTRASDLRASLSFSDSNGSDGLIDAEGATDAATDGAVVPSTDGADALDASIRPFADDSTTSRNFCFVCAGNSVISAEGLRTCDCATVAPTQLQEGE